jgi:type IV pilus assembly protein PilM
MKLFAGNEPVFGLDIGHETLKVAVVSLHGGSANVISLAEVPIPRGTKTPQGIRDKDIVAQKIREAKETAKPRRIGLAACVSALPESLVFTKVIELPKMTEKEIAKAMPFQISHAFPVSAEEAYFDWAILGPGPKQDTLEALVVAAPLKLVEDFMYVVEKSGSELLALETKPAALTRLFSKKGMKGGLIIVDIGAVITGIDLVVDGNLHLTATVEMGGEALKQGLDEAKVIADEIRNLVKYYTSRLGEKAEFGQVALCGGGANVKGVPETLSKLLKINVAVGKPSVTLPTYNPAFATALGLALRGL